MSQSQDQRYTKAAGDHGDVIARIARGYERDSARAADLVQSIHIELWRSFAYFSGQCSERSWVFRIAHNVAVSHVIREKRLGHGTLVSLDDVEVTAPGRPDELLDEERRRQRLFGLIHQLKPADRQVVLLYLEDLSAEEIAEVVGLSPGAVSVRLHRAKALLATLYGDQRHD